MSKVVAILQSNYIPWKGVFDMINMVDIFVFLEDVDFTKRDWRTRNYIKSSSGSVLLSVPVCHSPRGTKINQIDICQDIDWQLSHYKSIVANYKKAPFFNQYSYLLDDFYLRHRWTNLSEMNIHLTMQLCSILGIKTQFVNSADLGITELKDDKLIRICKLLQATEYLSGPSAKKYIDNSKFKCENIDLSYIKYNYDTYQQLYGEFDHNVSVLDVLFNCGDEAVKFIFKGDKEIFK